MIQRPTALLPFTPLAAWQYRHGCDPPRSWIIPEDSLLVVPSSPSTPESLLDIPEDVSLARRWPHPAACRGAPVLERVPMQVQDLPSIRFRSRLVPDLPSLTNLTALAMFRLALRRTWFTVQSVSTGPSVSSTHHTQEE